MKTFTIMAVVCALAWNAALCTEDPGPTSCLWRVQSEHGNLYLLGSVHALTADIYPLPTAIDRAYAEADRLIFEVDLEEMQQAAFSLLARATLPENTTLADVVSPETHEIIARRLEESGLSIDGFKRMKPWFLAMTLLNFELTKAGFSADNGIDFHFFNRAQKDEKPISGLETAEFQISLFDALSQQQSEDFLRYTLADIDTVVPMLEEITASWKRGDLESLSSLLNESYEEFPKIFAAFVTERNNNWMPKLEQALQEDDTTLVVVGALHLVGEHGVIAELSRRGYTVTQL